jgi:hypothetical protein
MTRASGVSLTTTERVPGRPAPVGVAAVVLGAAAYVGLVVSAVAGEAWAFVLCLTAVAALELLLTTTAPVALWALGRVALGLPCRWAVTVAALFVLMVRLPGDHGALASWLVVCAVLLYVCAAGLEALAQVVEYLRKSPVLSRNMPLGDLAVSDEPGWLIRGRAQLLWPSFLLLTAGGALAANTTVSGGVGIGAAVAGLVLAGVLTAFGAITAWATRASDPRAQVPRAVQESVHSLAPDLVLYYGGSTEALYQVEMWLPTFEASTHRVLVVLRDREALRHLAPTRLPVLCVPAGTVLLAFALDTVRGALFVANAATNIHLLRKGGMRTAFIGHGDSDKATSSNPFAKVYDEIWVAGPAGARRYAGEDTLALGDRIRQVGRPQAVAAPSRSRREGTPVTVMYAPTWEGWGDEPFHSSLPHQGVELVRRLLAQPALRVIYRPHPLTGTRDGTVRQAHERVVAMLTAAGAPDLVPPGHGASRPSGGSTEALDDLALMMANAGRGATNAGTAGSDNQESAFWQSHGTAPHLVVAGGVPSSTSCLLQSDVLISDVSGIVSDWIGLNRPLAMTNPAGLGTDEFARRYPSSRAGVLIGPDCSGLESFLEEVASGRDSTRAARERVRRELLGTSPEDSAARFEAALDELARP